MVPPRSMIGCLSLCLLFGLSAASAARQAAPPQPAAAHAVSMQSAPAQPAPAQSDEANRQEFTITASEKGFDPAVITLKKGVPARLTFIRTSDKTCATEVVIPAYKVKKELPLDAKVSIQFTPQEAGDVGFACGHNMFKGTLVVQ